jgi:hypothetical protein
LPTRVWPTAREFASSILAFDDVFESPMLSPSQGRCEMLKTASSGTMTDNLTRSIRKLLCFPLCGVANLGSITLFTRLLSSQLFANTADRQYTSRELTVDLSAEAVRLSPSVGEVLIVVSDGNVSF